MNDVGGFSSRLVPHNVSQRLPTSTHRDLFSNKAWQIAEDLGGWIKLVLIQATSTSFTPAQGRIELKGPPLTQTDII